ncbi:hypothetical protein EVA_12228, partial [gut metagenome]
NQSFEERLIKVEDIVIKSVSELTQYWSLLRLVWLLVENRILLDEDSDKV